MRATRCLLASAVLLAAGCGSSSETVDSGPSDPGSTDVAQDLYSGPIVDPVCDVTGLGLPGPAIPVDDFFNPPSETRPFPNMALAVLDTGSATGIRPRFEQHPFAEILNELDGFGSTAPFVVPLAQAPDPGTIGDSTVFLVRIDVETAIEPDPGRLKAAMVPLDVAWSPDAGALVAEPLVPLEERASYALVVTRCLKYPDGSPVGRAPAMDALDADANDGTPMAEGMAKALAFLGRPDVNVPPDSVAIALPTVVRSTGSRMKAVAAAAASAKGFDPVIEWAASPALPDGSLDPDFLARYDGLAEFMESEIESGEGPLHFYGSIGVAAQGHFTAARYLDPETWFEPEEGKTPQPIESRDVRFFLTVPKEDPAAGLAQPFPVVVFQHAFGVCKETALVLAGAFARQGLATIGIDAIEHGHRASGGKWKCPTDPMKFLTLYEPIRLWFNFAQSALDLAQLSMMAGEYAPDLYPLPGGDGKPDLAGGVVGLAGQSMGAFLSATAMGFADDVGPVLINVGGGQEGLFFAWSMLSSTGLDPMTLSFANVSGLVLDIMGPVQMSFDDVEPLTFARGMFGKDGPKDRHVLLQEAMQDEAVPGACTFRLARVLGVPRLTPGFHGFDGLDDHAAPIEGNMEDGRTGALAQFSPAAHEFLLTNHSTDKDPYQLVRAQAQAAAFFRSFFDEGVSTVIDPYDPVALAPYMPQPEKP